MSTPAPLPELSPLDLAYRPDLGVLAVRWLRDVSFAELQAGFQAAAELSYAQTACRWLVDVRRRSLLDAEQSEWVAQLLLPQAAARLHPASLRVAYLLSPARIENLRLAVSLPLPAVSSAVAAEQAYALRTFDAEGQAMQWLLT